MWSATSAYVCVCVCAWESRLWTIQSINCTIQKVEILFLSTGSYISCIKEVRVDSDGCGIIVRIALSIDILNGVKIDLRINCVSVLYKRHR